MLRLPLIATLLLIAAPAHAGSYFGISSTLIGDGGTLPRSAVYNENGCNGENMSPPLQWAGAPAGTRSYAVSMYDSDARPAGVDGKTNANGFVHWVVLNIPADTYSLDADAGKTNESKLPDNAHALNNSFGKSNYSGACPPVGDEPHHYEFTVYAMPNGYAFYPLSAIGRPTMNWLKSHALASATMTVTYGR